MKCGQARKSLWIETFYCAIISILNTGQARKSLWIETFETMIQFIAQVGQARKSLWIETRKKGKVKICAPWSGS